MYSEYTLRKGRIFWIAYLVAPAGCVWTYGAPTRIGITKNRAIKKAERYIDHLNHRDGYVTDHRKV